MDRRAYHIVNGITLYRLVSAPVLVLLIINGRQDLFRWLLGLSFFTDGIDGFLARRYKVTSVMGSRLDSIADDLTIAAATIGMIVFKTEFIKQEIIMFILLFTIFLFQMFLAFMRYGKPTSFHTYGAKTAALMQGIFLILLFFLPEPVIYVFYLACFITGAQLIEEIILTLLLPTWEANVKGLYWVLKRGKKQL
jgi:CDP-diacylglycerol--glycerol-3-phosphate 3-phosphatidyltransferase